MTNYVLGIDGGGTRTRAAIMDTQGNVIGLGKGGTSTYDDIGVEIASINIKHAVDLACRQAGLGQTTFSAAFLGLGGVSSEEDRQTVKNIALSLMLAPKERIGTDHDIRIALAGGLSGRPGIVQIAGTGSSCYGRDASGHSWRSGGWGPLISDEGSGYWLGIEAMKAATRAADGRSPSTSLLSAVMTALNLSSIDEIMFSIYVKGMTRSEIASLGPLVTREALSGDRLSQGIIEKGSESMAECISTVARHLDLEDNIEIALTGGVFQAGDIVIKPLKKAVLEKLPSSTITISELPPVLGACLLALELLDVKLSIQNLHILKEKASLIKNLLN